ncbi:Ig-like domain-containing protein, partial [Planctomycetota bacterium]
MLDGGGLDLSDGVLGFHGEQNVAETVEVRLSADYSQVQVRVATDHSDETQAFPIDHVTSFRFHGQEAHDTLDDATGLSNAGGHDHAGDGEPGSVMLMNGALKYVAAGVQAEDVSLSYHPNASTLMLSVTQNGETASHHFASSDVTSFTFAGKSINDVFVNETSIESQTLISHSLGDDRSKAVEHSATFNLVADEFVTHTAVSSGDWSDVSIWENGSVPADGARVLIAEGAEVTVDGVYAANLRTIRVDGLLRFATDRDTQLVVDTLVSSRTATVEMGTADNPVQAGVTARITIQDYGNEGIETADTASPDYDPLKVGLGVILHGQFTTHGQEKDGRATMDGAIVGADRLTLDAVPADWSPGDEIVIAGVTKTGDEARVIREINGNEVVLDEVLAKDHTPPRTTHEDGLKVHVVNVTRNVILETAEENRFIEDAATEEEKFGRRGHLMFMHSNAVDMYYAKVDHFGRTIKSHAANDTIVDDEGNVVRIGTNPRARYGLHFHRGGYDSQPAYVVGTAVVNSPGWGFVNHSSYVHMIDNVSYDISGAAFVTEVGDEVGSFVGNTAIRNLPFTKVSRTPGGGDTGRGGSGFWNHATAIDLQDNVVSGFSEKGIFIWGDVIATNVKTGQPRLTQSRNIVPAKFLTGVPVGGTNVSSGLPVNSISNNTVYAGKEAFSLFRKGGTKSRFSHVNGLTVYNAEKAVQLHYSTRIILKDLVAVGNLDSPERNGAIGQTRGGFNIRLINGHVEGFAGAWNMPIRGAGHLASVEGGYYNNVVNFHNNVGQENLTVISGDIEFGTLSEEALGGAVQANIASGRRVHRYDTAHAVVTKPDLRYIDEDGDVFRIYAVKEQSPDYIPHPAGVKVVNRGYKAFQTAFKGKTNAQLMEEYGYTFAGRMLPDNAVSPEGWRNAAIAPIVDAVIPQITINDINVDQSNAVFNEDGEVVIKTPLSQNGDMIIITDVTQPSVGKVRIGHFSNEIIYTPTLSGSLDSMTFEFSVSNGRGDYETRTVTIHGNEPGNARPVANSDSEGTRVNEAITIDVLANDSDADGDALSVISVDLPNPVMSGVEEYLRSVATYDAGDGSSAHNPVSDAGGNWAITGTYGDISTGAITAGSTMLSDGGNAWKISDATTGSGETVSYNQTLSAEDKQAAEESGWELSTRFQMDDSIDGTVAVHVAYGDGDTAFLVWLDLDSSGDLVLDLLGGGHSKTVTSGGTGADAAHDLRVRYDADSQSAAVYLDDQRVDDGNWKGKSHALDGVQFGTGSSNGMGSVSFGEVAYSIPEMSYETRSEVVVNADNTITYTPADGFVGTETFNYTISDGNGGESTATVNVTVNDVVVPPTNTAPIATNDSATTDEDNAITVNVLANDSDADGDVISVLSATAGANGTTAVNADGTITYTPNADFHGTDSFDYTIDDGNGGQATGSVNVTIASVNDAPVATGDTAATDEDNAVIINVLGNDSDADGDVISVLSATAGANGTATVNADGTITYTPNADFHGTDSFAYTISDGNGGRATGSVNVTIASVNDAPVATGDTAATDEDNAVIINVLGNDSDA